MRTAPAQGFADPPLAAQACFRRLLDAMARPGTRATIDDVPAPAPLMPAAGAVALTLCDADTPVWLDPGLCAEAVVAWLRFHSGCRIVAAPADAAFAFAADPAGVPFNALSAGSDEFPDRSATVILQVERIGTGQRLHLEGPGIETTATLDIAGLPAGFVAWRRANRALYPRGVDVVVVSGHTLVALPRSTAVAEG